MDFEPGWWRYEGNPNLETLVELVYLYGEEGVNDLESLIAAIYWDEEEVLIEKDIDVDRRYGRDGITCLILAAQAGEYKIVDGLVKLNADKEVATHIGGLTALHWATSLGHLDVMDLLVNTPVGIKKAKLETKDVEGYTPMLRAIQLGRKDPAKLLLKNGANVDARNTEDITALMMASEKAAMDLVHMLLEYGPDYDATDVHGCTIFEYAADSGDWHFYEALGEVIDAHMATEDQGYFSPPISDNSSSSSSGSDTSSSASSQGPRSVGSSDSDRGSMDSQGSQD